MVSPEQLQQRFGGLATDLKDNYWPPRNPSKDFGIDKERLEASSQPKLKNSIKEAKEVKTKNKPKELL